MDIHSEDPRDRCVKTIRDCSFYRENLNDIGDQYDKVYFFNCSFNHLTRSDFYRFHQCVFNECSFHYCTIGFGSILTYSVEWNENNEIRDITFMNRIEFHYCSVSMDRHYVDLRYVTDAICNNSSISLTNYGHGEGAENFHHKATCPTEGSFIGYKKARYSLWAYNRHYSGKAIITLEIPVHAKRSNAFRNKCRCSEAKILKIESLPGRKDIPDGATVYSDFDPKFTYRVGDIVKPDRFDDRWWVECAPGIHFFYLKKDAIEYNL